MRVSCSRRTRPSSSSTERRRAFWLDPRLVADWSCALDFNGKIGLVCVMEHPSGVEALVPPPAQKQIAIGSAFLDALAVGLGPDTWLRFPVGQHRATPCEGGTATLYTMMPTTLPLLADGRRPRIGGDPVEIAIGGRALGPKLFRGVSCNGSTYDTAIVAFTPSNVARSGSNEF